MFAFLVAMFFAFLLLFFYLRLVYRYNVLCTGQNVCVRGQLVWRSCFSERLCIETQIHALLDFVRRENISLGFICLWWIYDLSWSSFVFCLLLPVCQFVFGTLQSSVVCLGLGKSPSVSIGFAFDYPCNLLPATMETGDLLPGEHEIYLPAGCEWKLVKMIFGWSKTGSVTVMLRAAMCFSNDGINSFDIFRIVCIHSGRTSRKM